MKGLEHKVKEISYKKKIKTKKWNKNNGKQKIKRIKLEYWSKMPHSQQVPIAKRINKEETGEKIVSSLKKKKKNLKKKYFPECGKIISV